MTWVDTKRGPLYLLFPYIIFCLHCCSIWKVGIGGGYLELDTKAIRGDGVNGRPWMT